MGTPRFPAVPLWPPFVADRAIPRGLIPVMDGLSTNSDFTVGFGQLCKTEMTATDNDSGSGPAVECVLTHRRLPSVLKGPLVACIDEGVRHIHDSARTHAWAVYAASEAVGASAQVFEGRGRRQVNLVLNSLP